jgi:hypothetical protein
LYNVTTNDEGNYSVIVTNVYGADTGGPVTLTVTGPIDTNLPTVTIDSPAANAEFATNVITVSGGAADAGTNAGVNFVLVRVNGGAWASANLGGPPTSRTWSNAVTLTTAGTNTVEAKAIDLSGNESSPVAARNYFWQVPQLLTVNIVPPAGGTLTPDYSVPTNLFVGRNYPVVATANSGYLFVNWSNSVTGVSSGVPGKKTPYTTSSYAFVMQSNLVITVNFVTNLFPAVAGKYNGLYIDTNGASFGSAGFVKFKTDSKLKFSGQLTVEGIKCSFSGTFNAAGVGTTKALKQIGRKLIPSETFTVVPVLDTATATMTGTITRTSAGSFGATLNADKEATPPSAALAGQYTIILPNASSNPAEEPAGDGYLLVTLTSDKLQIKSKGYLGDGEQAKPYKPVMGQGGHWPYYAAQYKDKVNKTYKGAVIGWLQFTNAPATNVTGVLTWFKPVTAGGPPPDLAGLPYPGYTNQITILGSQFKPLTVPGHVIDVASGVATMRDGNLGSSPIATNFTYDAVSGKILFVKTNNLNVIKLTINYKNGEMKGSFLVNPADKLTKKNLVGAVLQNLNVARGMFPKGPKQDPSTESGSVSLP